MVIIESYSFSFDIDRYIHIVLIVTKLHVTRLTFVRANQRRHQYQCDDDHGELNKQHTWQRRRRTY
jgi:hypothetical protein